MKIIAWNVNGIKSLLETEFLDKLLKHEKPDIFCMGETKVTCGCESKKSCTFENIKDEINKRIPEFKYKYWSECKSRGGYSGTAIFTKKKPENIYYGLNDEKGKELDDEGRVIVLEFKKYYLLHVYTPNSGRALERLHFRTKTWDKAFTEYINKLQKNKPIIVCGDLNVAHHEIDLKNPKTNLKTAGFTVEERKSFDKILKETELIDSYRLLNPEKIEYSFWSYMRKSREKNIGWRLDYFLISDKLKNKVNKSEILTNTLGSDHAPIKLEIKL